MEDKFRSRIKYYGDLKEISTNICKDFNLGNFKANQIILVGYEDFNFILETSKGKYVVKVFSDFRTLEDCYRYVEIIEKAMEKEVATPYLFKSDRGYLYVKEIDNVKLRLCVMQFISGKTFYESKEKLREEEIKYAAHQLALINSIKLKPKFIYDWWAISNFLKEFKEKGKDLLPEDFNLLKGFEDKFKKLNIDKLPHCFVHGDVIATNLMKDNEGKLWIIDFSVSNYYPRIQELAVFACDLLFDRKNKSQTERNIKTAIKEYTKLISLTKEELSALPTYIELAHAMHVLCAGYEKAVRNNNSEENEHFLNSGRMGLG